MSELIPDYLSFNNRVKRSIVPGFDRWEMRPVTILGKVGGLLELPASFLTPDGGVEEWHVDAWNRPLTRYRKTLIPDDGDGEVFIEKITDETTGQIVSRTVPK